LPGGKSFEQRARKACDDAAVAPQPFFEAALAGTGYCNGFANCTQAVLANEGNNGTGNLSIQNVWSLYSDLDNGGFNFPRSMLNSPLNCPTGVEIGCNGQISGGVGVNASVGHGNYNAGFVTFKMNDWHGLTAQSNLTWSKALGTGSFYQATSQYTPNDPFDLDNMYGVQGFDRTWVSTTFFVYQPPFYRGQQGLAGHAHQRLRHMVGQGAHSHAETGGQDVLATAPQLLLLDEVMAGLRPTETDHMVALFRELNTKLGLTILLIEHVMRAVMALSSRLIVLHHGQVIASGSPAEVTRDPAVLECYLGEEAV
jgi:hypothetical protein